MPQEGNPRPVGRRGRGKKTLYRAIYEEQKEKILSGAYATGEMMPYERELCEQYGVDRITVRKALEMLVADGLLEKRPGLGSFVKSPIPGLLPGQAASRNVLFVMSNNTNDINSNPAAFNSELFYAIGQECRQRSYSLFYSVLEEDGNLEGITNGNSFACILFVSYVPKRVLDRCAELRVPAICINHRHEGLLSIMSENEKGVYQAIRYLHEQGHRRIGMMLGRPEYCTAQERLRGYEAAIRDLGLELNPDYMLGADWTFDGARNVVLNMLDSGWGNRLPSALFCASDMMALGAMDAFRERGIDVPDDISIMGFDNVQQSRHVSPRLSTVSVDVGLMARVTVEQIAAFEKTGPSGGYFITIPAGLEKRQSVKTISRP